MAILLPEIRADFHVSYTILGLLSCAVFALFYVTLGIPDGQLADRFNRRNLVELALTLWSTMTALPGLTPNIW
jgi:predicted MFS family arabinose efflux permease